MSNKFIDVASFQPSSAGYFQAVKNAGISGVVVKLTEGTSYTSPSASPQINQAKNHGLKVSVYHFARFSSDGGARADARYFLNAIQARGLGKSTPVVCDVETGNPSAGNVNAFFKILTDAGYKNIAVYSGLYFYRAHLSGCNGKKWIAEYNGRSSCSMKCDAWQYTDNGRFAGSRTDVSFDYCGIFTDKNYHGSGDSNSDRENQLKLSLNEKTKLAECYSFINMILGGVFDKWLH